MKNFKFILMAVMAGFLALAFPAFAGNSSGADAINMANTGTVNTTFVAADPRAEALQDIRARLVDLGADIVCERPFSLLFVDYESNRIIAIYAVTAESLASDGVQAKDGTPDATLRDYAVELCDAGILQTFEQDVDAQISG